MLLADAVRAPLMLLVPVLHWTGHLSFLPLSAPFQAVPLWVLPLHVPAWALALAILASGVGNGVANPTIHSLFTLRLPPAVRAKGMTAMMTMWGIFQPLGLLVAGPALSTVGVDARPRRVRGRADADDDRCVDYFAARGRVGSAVAGGRAVGDGERLRQPAVIPPRVLRVDVQDVGPVGQPVRVEVM